MQIVYLIADIIFISLLVYVAFQMRKDNKLGRQQLELIQKQRKEILDAFNDWSNR